MYVFYELLVCFYELLKCAKLNVRVKFKQVRAKVDTMSLYMLYPHTIVLFPRSLVVLLHCPTDLYTCTTTLNWLFNVTTNDISVIYVTAHRCAGGLKKKLDLRSGSQRHRHFVGFFNVPVLAPTRDQPFYTVIPTHRPI